MFAKNLSPPLKSINIFMFNSKTKKSINEFVTKKKRGYSMCPKPSLLWSASFKLKTGFLPPAKSAGNF